MVLVCTAKRKKINVYDVLKAEQLTVQIIITVFQRKENILWSGCMLKWR